MASDFTTADTIDPMTLTLQPDVAMDEEDVQPDWSQFTNILMDEGSSAFKFTDISSIQEDFFAGMDFNPAIDSDAGSLNYNSLGTSSMFTGTSDYSAFPNFPFTFQQPDLSVSRSRRLSITSSSSSSGGSNSLSPVMQSSATPVDSASPASSYTSSDPVDELAQRVIQSAGVLLAVPNNQHQQVQHHFSPQVFAQHQTSFDSLSHEQLKAAAAAITAAAAARAVGQSLVPIAPSPSTVKSSPSPTPPPPELASFATTAAAIASGSRPRTSHTTIERRYRTNLNTRIQSLRLVVPALRVLDKKKTFPEDAVDERGFVDGVKVARKCSKANVLGKAEEYIRVLKRREVRLVSEHNGLKALISGLVGGAALLKEWEKEWKAKYGGKEKDEIEGLGTQMEDSDDEEGDGDEDDSGGDGEGRKRKKPKIAPSTAKKDARSTTAVDGQVVPEKRKRGRPRKIAADPLPLNPLPIIKADPTPRPPQQYLLAVFALFSFFNSSPSSLFPYSKSENGAHTGHVLSSVPQATPNSWTNLIQTFHLLVSVLVFASIVTPWIIPARFTKTNDSILRKIVSCVIPGQSSPVEPVQRARMTPAPARRSRAALLAALTPARRGSLDEVDALRNALGADPGFFVWNWSGMMKEAGFEGRGLEQRAWVRLGEIISLSPSTSFFTRLQTYYCMSKHVPQFGACVSDLVTLSLVLYSIAPSQARGIWSRAQSRANTGAVRACERLVVENLTLDEAAKTLAAFKAEGERDNMSVLRSPVFVLVRTLVTERLEKAAKGMFVSMILGSNDVDADETDRTTDVRVTVEAAKSLGGSMAEMGDVLEYVFCDSAHRRSISASLLNPKDGDVQALLSALLMYKQIFPSSSSSSSSGPSIMVEDPKAQLELRRILDEAVFDSSSSNAADVLGGLVEDARDRVVDLLVELERKGR